MTALFDFLTAGFPGEQTTQVALQQLIKRQLNLPRNHALSEANCHTWGEHLQTLVDCVDATMAATTHGAKAFDVNASLEANTYLDAPDYLMRQVKAVVIPLLNLFHRFSLPARTQLIAALADYVEYEALQHLPTQLDLAFSSTFEPERGYVYLLKLGDKTPGKVVKIEELFDEVRAAQGGLLSASHSLMITRIFFEDAQQMHIDDDGDDNDDQYGDVDVFRTAPPSAYDRASFGSVHSDYAGGSSSSTAYLERGRRLRRGDEASIPLLAASSPRRHVAVGVNDDAHDPSAHLVYKLTQEEKRPKINIDGEKVFEAGIAEPLSYGEARYRGLLMATKNSRQPYHSLKDFCFRHHEHLTKVEWLVIKILLGILAPVLFAFGVGITGPSSNQATENADVYQDFVEAETLEGIKKNYYGLHFNHWQFFAFTLVLSVLASLHYLIRWLKSPRAVHYRTPDLDDSGKGRYMRFGGLFYYVKPVPALAARRPASSGPHYGRLSRLRRKATDYLSMPHNGHYGHLPARDPARGSLSFEHTSVFFQPHDITEHLVKALNAVADTSCFEDIPAPIEHAWHHMRDQFAGLKGKSQKEQLKGFNRALREFIEALTQDDAELQRIPKGSAMRDMLDTLIAAGDSGPATVQTLSTACEDALDSGTLSTEAEIFLKRMYTATRAMEPMPARRVNDASSLPPIPADFARAQAIQPIWAAVAQFEQRADASEPRYERLHELVRELRVVATVTFSAKGKDLLIHCGALAHAIYNLKQELIRIANSVDGAAATTTTTTKASAAAAVPVPDCDLFNLANRLQQAIKALVIEARRSTHADDDDDDDDDDFHAVTETELRRYTSESQRRLMILRTLAHEARDVHARRSTVSSGDAVSGGSSSSSSHHAPR